MYNSHVKCVDYYINISVNMINNVRLRERLTLIVWVRVTLVKYAILGFMKKMDNVGLPFI
jgi:hypothetical protein